MQFSTVPKRPAANKLNNKNKKTTDSSIRGRERITISV